MVFGPPRTLQRPRGHQRPLEADFFLAQTVPFDHSIDPWWSLTVSGPPGPSSGLKAIKGRLRPKFFLAQTVPFDHSIDHWWSLTVSGLQRTLQRPQGLQRSAKTKFFWGAGTIIHMKSTMFPWSRSEQQRRANRAVVASLT